LAVESLVFNPPGTGGLTVNGTPLLVPPLVVTVTLLAPVAAVVDTANVAVICVALTTVTPLTVIPLLPGLTVVAPVTKFVPASVTDTAVPCAPLFGLSVVRVGAGGFTVNGTPLLVPPLVVTVTLLAPVAAVPEIVNVAVICVELTTVRPLTVIPLLPGLTVAPVTKLVPVTVTGTVAPCAPLFGLAAVRVGAGGFTVNDTPLLVPPFVVTVTLLAPVAAVPEIVKVAVICVALDTVTLLTVIPLLPGFTVAPLTKLVPVSVTATAVPCAPLFGLTVVRVGAGGVTVNGTPLLVPPAVVAVTLLAPVAAVPEIVNVAVICVALTTVRLLTVIPLLPGFTVVPLTKFVPVSVTDTAVPCAPLFGLTVVSVGAGGVTVNGTPLLVPPAVVTVTLLMPVAAVPEIVNVAVICVALATVTLLTVIPLLPGLTVAPVAKLAPVSVTDSVAPCVPLFGLTAVRVGAGGFTVNGTPLPVPPAVVTVMLLVPVAAVPEIVNVAVICVAFTTVTPLTVIPLLPGLTVAPLTKFVPVRVTGTAVPCSPLFGLTDVSVGAGGRFTVNGTPLLVPPAVVTVTLLAPVAAVPEIVNVAVICVPLTTVTLLTVIPLLPGLTVVAPVTKFVPVSVTDTAVPCAPLFGLTVVRVGAGGFTVNGTPLLVPPFVVTVALLAPVAAVPEIVNVAVICVPLTTDTLLTVIPLLPGFTVVAPVTKLVPISVTDTAVPCAPLFGLTVVRVGAGGFTVNGTPLLVPPFVVTVTLLAPVADVPEIVNVAVICVALTTVTPLTVIPLLPGFTAVAPVTKLVPVSVTDTLPPCAPLFGLTVVSVGAGGLTVNGCPPLVPPVVVTVMLLVPVAAVDTIVKVAVICVELATVTPLTVIPLLPGFTVAPVTKLVPVSVTGTLVPCAPLFGLTVVSVGAGGVTVNGTPLLIPLFVVTVTLLAPVSAVPEIVNVAVICVALTTVTPLTVIPPLPGFTVAPVTKFVPVSVTGTMLPWAPKAGDRPAMLGAPAPVAVSEPTE
jgi:hypothetical protein